MKHLNQRIRVAIDSDNPSVVRIEEKCIKCGQCARICSGFVGVNDHYDLDKTGGNAICINCGQCIKVCPADSLVGNDDYKTIQKLIDSEKKNGKVFVVSTSPAVRVALGDAFGFESGSFVQGKMITLLRKLGFDYVLDTNFGADLTICEEAAELVSRIKNGGGALPQFSSCCPAWVKFVEYFYPEMRENLSTCKSPIGMQGATVKTYFAGKIGVKSENIINCAITPCVAKKAEILRGEMNGAAKVFGNLDMRDTDYVFTTNELIAWAKEQNININDLPDGEYDDFLGQSSGAGVIFGNTGGVMEAAMRTAYSYLTGKEPSRLVLNLSDVRGYQGIKEAVVDLEVATLRVAVVFGTANARALIERIKSGEKFDFVEVMTCPGGCIGGGGQPKHLGEEAEVQKKRISSLYNKDKVMPHRASHENPQIIALYREYLEKPNSPLAEEILHTMYCDRSGDLGE
jgi:ferredoxin hydrogenase